MPVPSPGLDLATLDSPPTAENWNDEALAVAKILGLPTTAFQAGQPERTIFAVVSNLLAEDDVGASVVIQAGFLDFAATGSVTYTAPDGTLTTVFVTPDPGIPAQNPTGSLGWLDVLADSLYNVRRILSTFAGGTLALLNTSASTYGAFTPGTYHVAQPGKSGSPSYHNAASLTVAPSSTVGGGGVVSGTANNSGAIRLHVTGHGLADGAAVFVVSVGGTVEADGAWLVTVNDADHFTLRGSAFVNAWTSGGKVYAPTLAAFSADVTGSASSAVGNNLVTTSITSLIGVQVANIGAWTGQDTEGNVALANRCRLKLSSISNGGPAGAYLFFALSAQTFAPTVLGANGLPLTGRPSSAITRALVQVDRTTKTVTTTIANADANTSGLSYPQPGSPAPDDGGDVYAVGSVIQAYAVPLGTTSIVQAAAVHAITVAGTLYVPGANAAAAGPIASVAVATYFQVVPVGGVSDPSGPQNVLPVEGVRAAIATALKAANIPMQDLVITLDGGSGPLVANVQLLLIPVPEVAQFTNSASFFISPGNAGNALLVVGV